MRRHNQKSLFPKNSCKKINRLTNWFELSCRAEFSARSIAASWIRGCAQQFRHSADSREEILRCRRKIQDVHSEQSGFRSGLFESGATLSGLEREEQSERDVGSSPPKATPKRRGPSDAQDARVKAIYRCRPRFYHFE